MNPQGIVRSNDDADGAASVEGQPSAVVHAESSLTNQPLVPDYELIRRIGGGAYGEVFLARSRATGVLRASKIVWRRSFNDDRPFQREFEGLQRFERISREHPSQLTLFHIGRNEAQGYFYYVMELADGIENPKSELRNPKETRNQKSEGSPADAEIRAPDLGPPSAIDLRPSDFYVPHTLRADLGQGRLPAAQVLEIGLALTEALGHLHRNCLIHRDVKPSNVIYVNGRPKLADIGLVTDASDQCSIVGTEGYLPPEGPGTPQADIFALGKVLYEAATGLDRRKFPQLPADLRAWPDSARVFELNEITLKACESDAHRRYQRCEELQRDLELLRQGRSVRRQRTWAQRRSVGKWTGLALIGLAVIAALISVVSRQPSRSEYSSDGPPSKNMVANTLCAKAMLIIRGDNTGEFGGAYTNFHRSIELDPHFARPYVGLLELRLREYVPGLGAAEPEELRTVARQLKKLAPDLAATWCAQSIINWYDWNYPQAQHCALESIHAAPEYELGHTWYGFMLCMWGYPVEGRAQLEISRALAPSKVTIYRCLGQTYYVQRDYANAIALERQALALEPHHGPAYRLIGEAQQAMGDYEQALTNLELSLVNAGADAAQTRKWCDQLLQAFRAGGARGYWQRYWEETEKYPNTAFYWKACLQAQLGNSDAALSWLKKSCDIHERSGWSLESPLNYLLLHNCWDGLHDNPRFKAVLDKIGFTKVNPI